MPVYSTLLGGKVEVETGNRRHVFYSLGNFTLGRELWEEWIGNGLNGGESINGLALSDILYQMGYAF